MQPPLCSCHAWEMFPMAFRRFSLHFWVDHEQFNLITFSKMSTPKHWPPTCAYRNNSCWVDTAACDVLGTLVTARALESWCGSTLWVLSLLAQLQVASQAACFSRISLSCLLSKPEEELVFFFHLWSKCCFPALSPGLRVQIGSWRQFHTAASFSLRGIWEFLRAHLKHDFWIFQL